MLKLVVETAKIYSNFSRISKFLAVHNLNMIFSIKALAGEKNILKKICNFLPPVPVADSRIEHFESNNFSSREKVFMNIPPLFSSELYLKIVTHTDICYLSRIEHLRFLEEACRYIRKPFQVILFVDAGEKREGYHIQKERSEIYSLFQYLSQISSISLVGVATNMGCMSEKVPTIQSATAFEDFCEEIQKEFSLNFKYIIGGSSNFLPLLEKGFVPRIINTMCLGGSILLGDIPGYQTPEGKFFLQQDIFHLYALICEIKKMPHKFVQLLLYIGKNDIHPSDLVWDEVEFRGISSDYMIVVVSEDDFQKYVIHGEFLLSLKYSAVPKVLSSPYTTICIY